MIFDHDVKHDGKWYPMGTDVPVGTTVVKPVESVQQEKEAKPVVSEEPKKPVTRGRKKKV